MDVLDAKKVVDEWGRYLKSSGTALDDWNGLLVSAGKVFINFAYGGGFQLESCLAGEDYEEQRRSFGLGTPAADAGDDKTVEPKV